MSVLSSLSISLHVPDDPRENRRNVRLRKGFVNRERAPFGGYKLRIPSLLFMEKMRTQSRFNVREKERASC